MSFNASKKVQLASCATFKEGYVNPSQKDQTYFGNDIKWLRATDLNDGFVFNTSRGLSEKGFASAGKSALLFEPGTLAISKSGTIGRIGILKDFMCGNRAVINIKVNPECDTRFIFYTLLLNRQKIETLAEGSVQKNLYVSSLGKLEFDLPSLEHQKRISETMGALDDRITLLRETNATLEAIAQSIFKSWFVDFDPVHAKQQGRVPEGMDESTAALFPNNFEESEQWSVPKGWSLSRLGDEVLTVLGGTPSRVKPELWGGQIPWINSGKVNEFRIIEPTEYITQLGLDSSSTKILPSRTTVIAITGATLGQVSLTEIETCANQSVVGVVGTDAIPSEFIYFWVKEHIAVLLSWQTGGAQQHINKNNVNDLPILCPDKKVISAFINVVRPLFDQIKSGCFESSTLTTLRDTLLPRLISGQLRLPEPEAVIKENFA